ncbi:MAG: lysophospholipase [Candidatus Obscuribacterales bacterium]|nr:lysophospholipase [Candidatus Obscuribacterales bacterium]
MTNGIDGESTELTAPSKSKTTLRKELLKFAGYCAIGYIVLLGIMHTPFYTFMVLRPDINDSELYKVDKILEVPREEVTFESKGNKLYGWLFLKKGSKVIVVFHHGNAGNLLNRLSFAKALIQAGASVFLYDYRGYGKSGGQANSLEGIHEDGLAAYDYIKSKYNMPVMVNFGESIGSTVACHVDNQRKSDALILQSALVSLPAVARKTFPIFMLYPDAIWPKPFFNNIELVSSSRTPLLLIHGLRDKLVPPQHSEMLLKADASTDKEYVQLPTCGHNDIGYYDPELYQKTLNDFFAKHFKNDLATN